MLLAPVFLVIVPISAIFQGCAAKGITETLAKMAACSKTAVEGDLGHGIAGAGERSAGFLQTAAANIGCGCRVEILLKQAEASALTGVDMGCQLLYGERFVEVAMDIDKQLLDLVISLASAAALFDGGACKNEELEPDVGEGLTQVELVAPIFFGKRKDCVNILQKFFLYGVTGVKGNELSIGSCGQRQDIFRFNAATFLTG